MYKAFLIAAAILAALVPDAAAEVKYYADYITHWGVPQGLLPLTEEQAARRAESYRIETEEGKVRRFTLVNGSGHTPNLLWDGEIPPLVDAEYKYDAEGRLAYVTEYDHAGKTIRFHSYRHLSRNCVTIKFDSRDVNYPANPDSPWGEDPIKEKVSSWRVTFDNVGRKQEVAYLSYGLQPTGNVEGVQKRYFTYSQEGFLLAIRYSGHLKKLGYAEQKWQYDAKGNITKTEWLDEKGKLTFNKQGEAFLSFKYDAYGNMIESISFDPQGKPCKNSDGYTKNVVLHDKKGNIVQNNYFDEEGQPCRKKGLAEERYKYDARGNCVESRGFGLDGKLCLSEQGWAKAKHKYDEKNHCIETAFFGVDGQPCESEEGFAKITFGFDRYGNLNAIAYFDAEGHPCAGPEGFAIAKFSLREDGEILGCEFLDPPLPPWRRWLAKRLSTTAIVGATLILCFLVISWKLRKTMYLAFLAKKPQKIEYFEHYVEYWGVPKGITPLTEEELVERGTAWRIISRGDRVEQVTSVNGEGLPHLTPCEAEIELPIDRTFHYNTKGQLTLALEFDALGEQLARWRYSKDFLHITFDSSAEALVHNKEKAIVTWRITNDTFGRIIRKEYLDHKGNPTHDAAGVSGELITYSPEGLPCVEKIT